jgi:hypothetical protein
MLHPLELKQADIEVGGNIALFTGSESKALCLIAFAWMSNDCVNI